ncbi:hypothetical protein M5G22_29185 [Pseudomonas sp. TNT2022 ID233]|uniref:hypothetical protein n=1 Tax=Pseudomonas aphyarum TaxID=2942629 RepID=UPI002360330F|nr:hypothetical protein [Pseudomonas aphyarum]MDD1141649.1 hypothetical protein [Pseudomonas aphyarum]
MDEKISLLALAKVEAPKLVPMGGGLLIYGLTAQEWAALFMASYALAMFIDFVGRRWLWPLIKFAWLRSRKPDDQVPPDAGGYK